VINPARRLLIVMHVCRLSSEFFPWGNVHYRVCELPDYEAIKAALAAAGEYARETGQRLTTHPSEFTKLAATSEEIVEKTLADLELHSEV
jgi:UV DNA damage endonuclease